MTTGHSTSRLHDILVSQQAGQRPPAVAEPDIRRQVLAGRLLGDVGAVLLGLTVAQGIQQALLALSVSDPPRWPVGAFNGLAISIWIAMFASAGLYDARRLINAADEFKLIRAATCAMWSRAPVGSASRSSDSSTTTVRAARLPPACPR